ncbi:MAG: protein kinase [Pirellulaceae bacterium]
MRRTLSADWGSSGEPSVLRDLNAEQRERFEKILDGYMTALERSEPLDEQVLLDEHPDLAPRLRFYFRSLQDLHQVASAFHRPGHADDSGGSVEPASESPRRMGDFELLREIGRGGMGIVYEARQISLARRVALKVLPFSAVLEARQIARFRNEAQAAAQLQHENIVPVYAIGVEQGIHYYAMQLIEGTPLNRLLDNLRQPAPADRYRALGFEDRSWGSKVATGDETAAHLSQGGKILDPTVPRGSLVCLGRARDPRYFLAVAAMGVQIARALHAAHELGVIHRDIKPSNVLLDSDDKVWVTDFGLARIATDCSLTRTGDVVGTMQYMSPEQARGQSALVDQRSDIYSLGATLYELLTWHAPGAAGAGGPEPVRVRLRRPGIPRDLETVIHKALATARDERYVTAQELAEDLQCVLDGKPTKARPAGLTERAVKWARRHHRSALALAVAGILALGGLVASVWRINHEKLRAEENYERSTQYFHEAQEAVDQLGARLAERLAEVPAASEVRRDLLHETLRYYERFAAHAEHDPALQLELATTYSKVATLTEQLGSTVAALAAQQRAIALFERLDRGTGEDVRCMSRLAQSYNNYGLGLQRAGRTSEALQAFGKAIHIQESLAARFAESAEYRSDLARTYSNLGLLRADTGHVAEAQAAFAEAIARQEQLVSLYPQAAEYRRELAATLNNSASLLAPGQLSQAIDYCRRAGEHQRIAAELEPANLRHQADAALTCNNLGALLARTGTHDEAEASYEDAIRIQKDLVRQEPAGKSYRHDLAVTHNNLATARTRAGQLPAAEQAARAALDWQQPLIEQDPDDVAVRSTLGGVFNNLGMILEQLQRPQEAAEAYRAAVEHQQVAQQRAPEVSRYRQFLSKHYYNYGRILRALGKHDEALAVARQRRSLWPGDPDRLISVAEECALAKATECNPGAASATDLALETLEMALKSGASLAAIRSNPRFGLWQDHPRFVALANP